MVGIQHLADEIAKREDKVDVLINNAGVAWGATLEEFPESGWDKVMDVNVKGIFFLFQKLIPLLRKSASAEDPARVINIASIDGLHTSPFSGYAYGTSKAAVIHLTRFMAAQHVGEHILVNGIAPGPFPTWMLSTGVGFGGETEGVDWDSVAERNPSGLHFRSHHPVRWRDRLIQLGEHSRENSAPMTVFVLRRSMKAVIGMP